MDLKPKHQKLRNQSFSVQWRAAFVRLPRLTPRIALHITSPEGPFPFIVSIPTRSDKPHVPVWIWLPPAPLDPGAVPVHIDFHGGGFFMGSPVEQGPFCAKLAKERNIVVLCVDFSQGPRYGFPAALLDAEDVLDAVLDTEGRTEAGRLLRRKIRERRYPQRHMWLSNDKKKTKSARGIKLDPNRLSLSGFSSGGNIALNLVLSTSPASGSASSSDASDSESDWPCRIPPSAAPVPLILFYPSFDMRLLPHERPRPDNVPPSGSIGKTLNKVLGPSYLAPENKNHPRANPGLQDTREITSRAHVFLVLAEIDTLAVQSQEWIDKMKEEGQGERLEVFMGKGMKHGWCNIPEKFISKEARRQKMEAYRQMMKFWDEVIECREGNEDRKEPG